MGKINVRCQFFKVWIKPDSSYHKAEDGFFKANTDSKIVIPEKVASSKEKEYQVGTLVGVGPLAEFDDELGKVGGDFKIGDKVAYTSGNVQIVKYKGEIFHFINSNFIIAVINDE